MRLDDLAHQRTLDSTNLLAAIDALPEAVAAAWTAGAALPLPDYWRGARQVLLAGMGPAALAVEMAKTRLVGVCPAVVLAWHDFDVPSAVSPETLVLALSTEGDDEETVSAALAAEQRGAAVVALTRGGELAKVARANGWIVGDVMTDGRAQTAAGPLADLSTEVAGAAEAMRRQQAALGAASPVGRNPAKRMAGQLMDRLPLIFAAAPLAPVAQHWKNQINLLAKAPAAAEQVPAMDHHAIAGTLHPEALISKYMVLVLRSTLAHPRAQWLADQTREIYMTAGFNTDAVEGTGATPLAHMLTAMHYGDYAAFYLAMCYGVDPSV
jgi:glucose/mannose-6-phosphate isomerase